MEETTHHNQQSPPHSSLSSSTVSVGSVPDRSIFNLSSSASSTVSSASSSSIPTKSLPLEILPTSSPNIQLRTNDVLHLIADTLDSLGLHETVTKLKQEANLPDTLPSDTPSLPSLPSLSSATESDVPIYSLPLIQEFRKAVTTGNWVTIYTLYSKIPLIPSKPWDYYYILFTLLRQHYLELLEHQSFTDALVLLRQFIVPFIQYVQYFLEIQHDDEKNDTNTRKATVETVATETSATSTVQNQPLYSSSFSFAPLGTYRSLSYPNVDVPSLTKTNSESDVAMTMVKPGILCSNSALIHHGNIRYKDLVYIGYCRKPSVPSSDVSSPPPQRTVESSLSSPSFVIEPDTIMSTDPLFRKEIPSLRSSTIDNVSLLSLKSSSDLTIPNPDQYSSMNTVAQYYKAPLVLSFHELFSASNDTTDKITPPSARVTYPSLVIPPLRMNDTYANNTVRYDSSQSLLTLPDKRELLYLGLSTKNTTDPSLMMKSIFSSTYIHGLSTLLLPNNVQDLYKISGWNGIHGNSRIDLLYGIEHRLHPSVLPRLRLPNLLGQAIMYQYGTCHGTNTNTINDKALSSSSLSSSSTIVSLTRDHTCTTVNDETNRLQYIPSRCVGVLSGHTDEVWGSIWTSDNQLVFSYSKDGEILVWSGTALVDSVTNQRKYERTKQTNTFTPVYRWKPMEDYDNHRRKNDSNDDDSNTGNGNVPTILPKPLNSSLSRLSITRIQIVSTLVPNTYLVAVVGTRASYALVYLVKYSPTLTGCTLYGIYDTLNDGGIIDCTWLTTIEKGYYRLATAGTYGGIWLWYITDPSLPTTDTRTTLSSLPPSPLYRTRPDKFWLTPREIYSVTSHSGSSYGTTTSSNNNSSIASSSPTNPGNDILVALCGGSQLVIINCTYTIDAVTSRAGAANTSTTKSPSSSSSLPSSSSPINSTGNIPYIPIVSQDISHLGYRATTCTLLPDNRHILCAFHRKSRNYKRITNDELNQYCVQQSDASFNRRTASSSSVSFFPSVSESNRGFPFSSSRIFNRLFGNTTDRGTTSGGGNDGTTTLSSSSSSSSSSATSKAGTTLSTTAGSVVKDSLVRHHQTNNVSFSGVPRSNTTTDGSIDERIILWDIGTGRSVRSYEGQGYRNERTILVPTIHSPGKGYDDGFVACGSEDGSVYIWSLPSVVPVPSFASSFSSSSSLPSLTPSTEINDTNLRYYYELQQYEHKGNVNHINWYPGTLGNHSIFITASDDHTLRVWS